MAAQKDQTLEFLESQRQRIRLHCYRMTGSLHDAEDLTQETFLKAWQKLPDFRDESALATWLYRIATNVCLDYLRGKKNRVLPIGPEFHRYQNGEALPENPPELPWLEPYPTPEEQAIKREHISIAFLTLLQVLPPNQRAALILAEVLGYSAKETAEMLGTSVAAVNSALQRARKLLSLNQAPLPNPRHHGDLVAKFLKAWESGDVAAIVAMMASDTVMVMPPYPLWVQGPADISRVFLDYPFRQNDPRVWKLLPAPRANGEPALGFYALDRQAGLYRPWGIQVLQLGISQTGGTAFIERYYVFKGPQLITGFGLPQALPAG